MAKETWRRKLTLNRRYFYFLSRNPDSPCALTIQHVEWKSHTGWYVTHDYFESDEFCLGPYSTVRAAKVVYLLQLAIRGWEES